MPIVRISFVLFTALTITFTPFDWADLPVMYPDIGDRLPDWLFTNTGLALVIVTGGYVWSEFRNIRRWLRYRWVDMESGGRYFRDLLSDMGMRAGVDMFDSMSSPHPEQPTSSPVASAFRWYVQEAINEARMEVWGVPENGSKPERLVNVDDDFNAYRKSREGDSLFLMMDGVYYRDLKIKRSTIKSYAKYVRKHDAELKRLAGDRKSKAESPSLQSPQKTEAETPR